MKKVKIIAETRYPLLEEAINEFIKDKNILDIQYADSPTYASALIVYKERRAKCLKHLNVTAAEK